jgi:hypothetical protein
VKLCVPIVNTPCRPPLLGFAVYAYTTVPLPAPPPPDVIVNQGALLVAVHEQPAEVVTAAIPLPLSHPAVALDASKV